MAGNISALRSKNAKKKARPAWDSTVSDVSTYRLSPLELEKRRLDHLSKNLDAARKDLYDKPKVTCAPVARLKKLISQMDDKLLEAEDEFFTKTKCTKGSLNVTVAPHILTNKENTNRIINGQLLTASPGGIKYNTVVTPTNPVLNEVSSDNDAVRVDEEIPTYQPSIDLSSYEEFINNESELVKSEGVATVMKEIDSELNQYQLEIEQGGDDQSLLSHTPQCKSQLETLARVSLVLIKYLKRARKELNEERRLQEQLLHTVEEQQSLLDIMATDVVKLEEKCSKLSFEKEDFQTKLSKIENLMSSEIAQLKEEMKKCNMTHPQFVPVFMPGPHPPPAGMIPQFRPFPPPPPPMVGVPLKPHPQAQPATTQPILTVTTNTESTNE